MCCVAFALPLVLLRHHLLILLPHTFIDSLRQEIGRENCAQIFDNKTRNTLQLLSFKGFNYCDKVFFLSGDDEVILLDFTFLYPFFQTQFCILAIWVKNARFQCCRFENETWPFEKQLTSQVNFSHTQIIFHGCNQALTCTMQWWLT